MTDTPVYGQMEPGDDQAPFEAVSFICRQIVGRVNTSGPVKVVAVYGEGLAPVGTVDVQPMVNQVDGSNTATPHGTVYGLPYIRIQGGVNAIICDPSVGDIGEAIYCSTDISIVKNTKGVSNPGSGRRFSMSDGIYLGGMLNARPTQYVWLKPEGGVVVVSIGKVTMTDSAGSVINLNGDNTGSITTSGLFSINANSKINGTLEVTGVLTGDSSANFSGDVVAGGTSLDGHTHDVVNVQGGVATIPTTPPL